MVLEHVWCYRAIAMVLESNDTLIAFVAAVMVG
jgi:hypothetical protein